MNVVRAAILVCDCQKGALVYVEDQQDANRVAYNMQRQIEAGGPDTAAGNGISFRICVDVEVGRCPACDMEILVAEMMGLPAT